MLAWYSSIFSLLQPRFYRHYNLRELKLGNWGEMPFSRLETHIWTQIWSDEETGIKLHKYYILYGMS